MSTSSPVIQMKSDKNAGLFQVFYDGQCPLCKREIDLIRWKDQKSGKLLFTDIADPEFDPAVFGKSLDEFHREIHSRDHLGNWYSGVDVFREIYRRIGFAPLVRISQWPIVRQALSLGYRLFAWIRYRTAIRRIKKAAVGPATCDSGCSPIGDGK